MTQDFPPDRGGMARRHVELCRRYPDGAMSASTVASPMSAEFDRGEYVHHLSIARGSLLEV